MSHTPCPWQTTLDTLQLQMPKAAFDQWLRNSVLLGQADGYYQIGVKCDAAKEWLDNRLRLKVEQRVAAGIRAVSEQEQWND